jgi:putative phage-type endonuclease
MTRIAIRDEAHWHSLRSHHIGGSEVAALFGRSPYTTPWQLWQTKAGRLNMPFNDKFTRAGKFFEDGIATWADEKWGMKIHKVRDYYADDEAVGMGATLDYADAEGVPVEIKFTHYAKDDWQYDGDLLTEIPEGYIFQCQHQMACYGGDYAWLVAFIKGEPRRMKVRRSEKIIESIRARVTEFWQSIRDDRPPPVDYQNDGEALSWMVYENGIKDIELPDMEDTVAAYMEAAAEAKQADERAKTFKAMISERAEQAMRGQNAPVKKAAITAGKYRVSLTEVDANPGKLVTSDMVGTRVGGKKGYLLHRFGYVKKEDGDE